MKLGEFIDQYGKRCTARCGCVGWASGFPRATRGTRAEGKRYVWIRCENCRKIKQFNK